MNQPHHWMPLLRANYFTTYASSLATVEPQFSSRTCCAKSYSFLTESSFFGMGRWQQSGQRWSSPEILWYGRWEVSCYSTNQRCERRRASERSMLHHELELGPRTKVIT